MNSLPLYHPTTLPLSWFLFASGVLFAIGLIGMMIRRNALMILLCIEILLNAANLSFVAMSSYRGDLHGQVIVFFVITVAALEVSVGLAIILLLMRLYRHLNVDEMRLLKW